MPKQEVHCRLRPITSPSRVMSSSTSVQKQVGQTIVQLPHVKQRSATSSQRGWSRFCISEQFAAHFQAYSLVMLAAVFDGHGRRGINIGLLWRADAAG